MRRRVRAEQNPVLILVEEPPSCTRLPPQFSNPRGNVYRHVRESIQIFRNIPQVLGKVPYMQYDELRFGMSPKDSITRLQQLRVAGEIVIVKRPIGMIG